MIKGGYILQPRQIDKSDISTAPPVVREVWQYLLRNVQHRDHGKLKRGQGFFTLSSIQEGLKWFVGYRKMTYSMTQMKTTMKTLAKTNMITTAKTTRGTIVTIINYNKFQDPKNYENTNEDTNEDTSEDTNAPTNDIQECKERKNDKNITLDAEAPKDFTKFWDLYGRKINKAKCLEIWNELTKEDIEKIFTHLPNYINSTPDIKFRLHPTTYLNRRNWNIKLDTYLSDLEIGNNEQFIKAWKQWTKHKQASNNPYKDKDQEQLALKILKKEAREKQLSVDKIITNIGKSIANDYKGVIT